MGHNGADHSGGKARSIEVGKRNLADACSRRTPEQRKEIARLGAQASADARRLRTTQAELIRGLLCKQSTDPEIASALVEMGVEPTIANAINFSMIAQAQRGSVEAAKYLRDTIGERPCDQLNLGLLTQPVKALDMARLSDDELEQLADREDADADQSD